VTDPEPLRILSLGGGTQSCALALMSARGDLPRLDAVVFADTQGEMPGTYAYLWWLAGELNTAGIPLHMSRFHGVRALQYIDWRNRFAAASHRQRLADRIEEIADDGLTEHAADEPRGDACTLMAAAAELHAMAAVELSGAAS